MQTLIENAVHNEHNEGQCAHHSNATQFEDGISWYAPLRLHHKSVDITGLEYIEEGIRTVERIPDDNEVEFIALSSLWCE